MLVAFVVVPSTIIVAAGRSWEAVQVAGGVQLIVGFLAMLAGAWDGERSADTWQWLIVCLSVDALLGACAVALATFLALNPYVLIALRDFVGWFSFQAGVVFATHPHGEAPNPWRYWELLREQGLPALVACLAGAAAIVDPRKTIVAIGLFGLLYFALFSVMRTQYDRFALPAMALLCIAGAVWLGAQITKRIGARAASGFALVVAAWIASSAGARLMRDLREPAAPADDYRYEMFPWIADHVPANATLVFESDTLQLLQTVYDPGDDEDRFHVELRRAFERVHPRLPKRIVKAQFIAAVCNYDPKQLDDGPLFFLASSQNRAYITANRDSLPEPATFYAALDARARVVHETGGVHEQLILCYRGTVSAGDRRECGERYGRVRPADMRRNAIQPSSAIASMLTAASQNRRGAGRLDVCCSACHWKPDSRARTVATNASSNPAGGEPLRTTMANCSVRVASAGALFGCSNSTITTPPGQAYVPWMLGPSALPPSNRHSPGSVAPRPSMSASRSSFPGGTTTGSSADERFELASTAERRAALSRIVRA